MSLRWCLCIAALLISGCTTDHAPPTPTSAPTPVTPAIRAAGSTFAVDQEQAREIATFMQFLDAYNHRHLAATLATFAHSPGIRFLDCDYRAGRSVKKVGRPAIASWLKQRFAEHDRLILAGLQDVNPEQPHGVLGASFIRRRSNTLAAKGYRSGLAPQVGATEQFNRAGRITTFTTPSGSSPDACHI